MGVRVQSLAESGEIESSARNGRATTEAAGPVAGLLVTEPQLVSMCLSILNGNDPEGVRGVQIADGNVFARNERVCAEAIARFVVIKPAFIVVKHPRRSVASTRLVGKPSGLVLLALPKAAHGASIPKFLPGFDIDMATSIQRGYELVAAR